MLFNRLVCHTAPCRLGYRTSIRMASTIVSDSGRVYHQKEVLQRHHQDEQLSIFKAESGNESFVFKRVPRSFYDVSLRLATEFAGSSRLRMHVDCRTEECILVYPYFKDTLLALIQRDPEFPVSERKKILRRAGEAIQELHSRDWVHIDVKPDNILVDWTCGEDSNKVVTNVALGDFDIAFKSEGGKPLQTLYAIGNAMWRSPEGQTASGITKASDVFSFGLVCIFTLGGGDFLLLNDYQELVKSGISPEQEILIRHFSYFGPMSEGLLTEVNDEDWRTALKGASDIAEHAFQEQPELRFENWGRELGPEAQDMISGMTNLNPTARATIDHVLAHQWWKEAI